MATTGDTMGIKWVETEAGAWRLATDEESRDLCACVVLSTEGPGSAEVLIPMGDVPWSVARVLGIDRADWESYQGRD